MTASLPKTTNVQGSVLLWIASGLAFALLLPVRVRVFAEITLYGGYAEASIACLGVRVAIPLRLYLLGGKQLQLDVLHKNGTTRKRIGLIGEKKPPSSWGKAVFRALRIERAEAIATLGIAGEPAATTLLCGAIENALTIAARLLLPDAPIAVSALPSFWKNACRLQVSGMAWVNLGMLIAKRLQSRGE